MKQTRYYVRVLAVDRQAFEETLTRNNIVGEVMSNDCVNDKPSLLYALRMDRREAATLKLSFPLVGMMDFNKVLGKKSA